jgi:hypothetical protein
LSDIERAHEVEPERRAARDGVVECRSCLRHSPKRQVAVAGAHDPLGRGFSVAHRLAIGAAAGPLAQAPLPFGGRRGDHPGGQLRERAGATRWTIGREGKQRVQRLARREMLSADVPEPVQLAAEQ